MNRYAFNVFLEKQRNNQQVEEGIIGKAAAGLFKGAKDTVRQKAKSTVTKTILRKGKEYGITPVARDLVQGKDIKTNLKKAVVQGAPAAGKKLAKAGMDKAIAFAKSGGFSGKFNRDMEARGVGSGVQYKSALGALKGGASTQILGTDPGSGGQDPLAGLSPAERRRARMSGAAGPVTF